MYIGVCVHCIIILNAYIIGLQLQSLKVPHYFFCAALLRPCILHSLEAAGGQGLHLIHGSIRHLLQSLPHGRLSINIAAKTSVFPPQKCKLFSFLKQRVWEPQVLSPKGSAVWMT